MKQKSSELTSLIDAIARCAAPGATSSSSVHSGQHAAAAADDDDVHDGYASDDNSADPELAAASAALARVVAGDVSALESAGPSIHTQHVFVLTSRLDRGKHVAAFHWL